MLHGNPAVDIFNGLKLAAGGELGIGVGEEEWGSGEREVLEGFIGRTEGLVDLVVSRFGEVPHSTASLSTGPSSELISQLREHGNYPRPSDGVVFSGIGALTRPSVKDVSSWMEWLHTNGRDTYGVRNNPSSAPRRTRRKIESTVLDGPDDDASAQQNASEISPPQGNEHHAKPSNLPEGPGVPPSIIAMGRARGSVSERPIVRASEAPPEEGQISSNSTSDESASSADTLMKYLTLGVYGSAWGIPSGRPPAHNRVSSLRKEVKQEMEATTKSTDKTKTINELNVSGGYFLVGLQGELDESIQVEASDSDTDLCTDAENAPESNGSNNRVMMRTLHVERTKPKSVDSNPDLPRAENQVIESYHDRLRVVVYIQKPFVFTFLFELQTDALAIPSFYRSLHHQLGPLQRPLLNSTSPSKVSERLWEAAAPKSTASTTSTQPICDLVYDPIRLTVHTTIPNIPEPGSTPPQGSAASPPPWTRIEALSVHSQILNTYASTRRHASELERTCKTSRGWWVVWMRLPYSSQEQQQTNADTDPNSHNTNAFREAFLTRKASDYVAPASARKPSNRFGRDVSGASGAGNGGGWGSPGKLAEGIGIDARQYIEGLLSLNR